MKLTIYYIVGCICTIVFFAWFLLASCASTPSIILQTAGLTWEGDLNPTEFDKWELVQITKEDSQSVHYIAKNPDENSPIHFISLVFGKEENHVLEYYYFKDGEPHSFIYYDELDKYKERIMPRWRKKRCFKCHKKTEV